MYRDEEKKFDMRVLDKHFPSDDPSRKEIYSYIDSLPDVSSKIDTDYEFDYSFLPSASKDDPDEALVSEDEALAEEDVSEE